MLCSGCPKRLWDDCIIREAYVISDTSLDIFGLEVQVKKGEHSHARARMSGQRSLG
jgi:hypothetical protein